MILTFKKNNETIKQFDSLLETNLIEKFAEETKNEIVEKVEIILNPNIKVSEMDLISSKSVNQIAESTVYLK